MLAHVVQTTSKGALNFGFHSGDIVQEWLWDDDVDDEIRRRIEGETGTELVDEDYGSAVDGIVLWWRDGDEEDDLADEIMDAQELADAGCPFWVLTPKPGRPGASGPSTVQNAAKTAGMNAATPQTAGKDWNAIRLRAFGKGRENNHEER